jgi:hypothetical protein
MQSSTAPSRRHSTVRQTRRGPHTRKQILDASLHLFSERGFTRTTVRDIATAAGITDAAIYYPSRRPSCGWPAVPSTLWMRTAISCVLSSMEGLGGDESALEQYRRLVDL